MTRCPSCSKISYPEKKQAVTAANFHNNKRHGRKGRGKRLSVYECPGGQGWHLTSRTDHQYNYS